PDSLGINVREDARCFARALEEALGRFPVERAVSRAHPADVLLSFALLIFRTGSKHVPEGSDRGGDVTLTEQRKAAQLENFRGRRRLRIQVGELPERGEGRGIVTPVRSDRALQESSARVPWLHLEYALQAAVRFIPPTGA